MAVEWDKVSKVLEVRLGKEAFNRWFADVRPVINHDDKIVLAIKDPFIKRWIVNNYLHLLQDILTDMYATHIGVEIVSDSVVEVPRVEGLNSRFTFENFVVGPCNSLAVAAAKRITVEPGNTFNPLFVYGGVGLGKTHLLQAIAHEIVRNGKYRVLYTTGQAMLNELMQALRNQQLETIRQRFRSELDVLIIDDIQVLVKNGSKNRFIQNEFFHLFNELYGTGRQIVISSDMYPYEMKNIHERLRSRFNWGLLVELERPDKETRIQIIKSKLVREGITLNNEVIELVADMFDGSIRELEGAINRLTAYTILKNIAVDKQMALSILSKNRPSGPAKTIMDVAKVVAEYFGVTVDDLRGPSRTKRIRLARGIAYQVSRDFLGVSLVQIGAFFNRSHSTILTSIKKLNKTDPDVDRVIRHITSKLT